ncbi:uncharacterized protein LOC134730975 [Pan paniscus]|uniref:uncharacterized protein LOC134730975 n=1 Tax=Pan paniscus TaxID=9597 RepID=UPI0030049F99
MPMGAMAREAGRSGLRLSQASSARRRRRRSRRAPGQAPRGLHRRPLPGPGAPHHSLPGKAELHREDHQRRPARLTRQAARSRFFRLPAGPTSTLAYGREVKGERGLEFLTSCRECGYSFLEFLKVGRDCSIWAGGRDYSNREKNDVTGERLRRPEKKSILGVGLFLELFSSLIRGRCSRRSACSCLVAFEFCDVGCGVRL